MARTRKSRRHPYFVAAGAPENFLILEVNSEGTAKELPIITSSTGHRYMYDEQSLWWLKLDKNLIQSFLLREHGLTTLHARFVAQHDMIQNVFINKRFKGCNDLRLLGSDEFKIASTIAEYLRLAVKVKEERNVWIKNNALIEADENKSDYKQGEWNNLYEKRCRLPRYVSLSNTTNFFCVTKKNKSIRHIPNKKNRSGNQIIEAKAKNKYTTMATEFFVRVDLFKLHQSSSETDWEQLLLKWKKWGVLNYMRSYIAAFFTGREADAKDIGLIVDDIVKDVDLMQSVEDVQDDDAEMDLI